MRIARVEPAPESGPYARSLRAIERHLPHAAADVAAELDRLAGQHAPPIPCPPHVSIVPGLGSVGTVLKVRVRSQDLTRGRSGGLRLLLQHRGADVWRPLFVYAKSERSDVSREEILKAIAAGP